MDQDKPVMDQDDETKPSDKDIRRRPLTVQNEYHIEEVLNPETPQRTQSPQYEQIPDELTNDIDGTSDVQSELDDVVPPIPSLPRYYVDRIRGERKNTVSPVPPPVPPRPNDDDDDDETEYSGVGSETSRDTLPSMSSDGSDTPRHPWRRRPISVEEGEIVENWKVPPPPAYEDAVSTGSSQQSDRPFLEPPIPRVELRTLSPDKVDAANGSETTIEGSNEYAETSFVTLRNVHLGDQDGREEVYADVPDVSFEKPSRPREDLEDVEPKRQRPAMFSVFLVIIGMMTVIGVLLLLILVPMTFKYLEYYRVGLKEQKSTGEIDEGKVYTSGRHDIGPDFKFREFYSIAHMLSFEELRVFSTEKLEFSLSCTFQYFLKMDELGFLFEKYDDDFEAVIEKIAHAEVKNAASQFSLNEFIREREKTEKGLHTALRIKLGGNCCPTDLAECIKFDNCMACSNATDCDRGYHLDVRYFQLGPIQLNDSLMDRFMTQQLLIIHSETENFLQEYAVTIKETDAMVEKTLNEVREINENATAISDRILQMGEADAFAVLEAARSNGLQTMYQSVGADTDQYKASVNLLFTIDKHPQLYMGIDYERYLRTVTGMQNTMSQPSGGT